MPSDVGGSIPMLPSLRVRGCVLHLNPVDIAITTFEARSRKHRSAQPEQTALRTDLFDRAAALRHKAF
jgi:hypothetical protein